MSLAWAPPRLYDSTGGRKGIVLATSCITRFSIASVADCTVAACQGIHPSCQQHCREHFSQKTLQYNHVKDSIPRNWYILCDVVVTASLLDVFWLVSTCDTCVFWLVKQRGHCSKALCVVLLKEGIAEDADIRLWHLSIYRCWWIPPPTC